MRLSYHHVNPSGGNESFLLRYQPDGEPGGTCVLVDAGANADLDGILRPSDELAAICLTHAHLDHYQSIERCHSAGTAVYASEPTAAILDDVFDVAERDYDVSTSATTTDALHPIDGWTELTPGFSVHPIPAGHVPGAVGYLFRADDGDDTYHVFATGDFTDRRSGGYPSLDADALHDIDVLFLSVSTDDEFEENFTEGLGRALQRAHSGSRTLVATSGLVGVQVAYLLSATMAEFDRDVQIRVVGQVAKLWETLDYDRPGVESIPVFEDPTQCLGAGAITIAGPEIPHERSSGRLFEELEDDPSATVIQLIGSGESPLRSGQCTVHAYDVVNHPTRDTIDEVHNAVDPVHSVIVHRHQGAGEAYNDLGSIVWSPTDDEEYVLYDDGWQSPPWMDINRGFSEDGTQAQNMGHFAGDLLSELSLPGLDRHETVDLAAEGVDLERIEEILAQVDAYEREQPAEETPEQSAAANGGTSQPSPSHDAMKETEDTGSDEPDADERVEPQALVDTTHQGVDGVDPGIRAAIESGDVDPETVRSALETSQAYQRGDLEPADADTTPPEDGEEVPSEEKDDGDTTEADTDDTAEVEEDDDTTEAASDDSPEVDDDDTDDSGPVNEETNQGGGDNGRLELDRERSTPTADLTETSTEIELDPVAAAIATDAATDADEATVGEFVAIAVREYVEAVVKGTVDESTVPPTEALLKGDSGVESALSAIAQHDEAASSAEDIVGDAVAERITPGVETTVTVPEIDPYLDLLDTVATADRFAVDSSAGAVAVAIVRRSRRQ